MQQIDCVDSAAALVVLGKVVAFLKKTYTKRNEIEIDVGINSIRVKLNDNYVVEAELNYSAKVVVQSEIYAEMKRFNHNSLD